MSKVFETVPAELTKRGDVLEGVIARRSKPNDTKLKRLLPRECDRELADHMKAMAEGETVRVEVDFDGSGQRTARLAGLAPLVPIAREPDTNDRCEAMKDDGGFVNPYTFVPTLPRTDGKDSRLPDGLGDAEPLSHARHGEQQWSGSLVLTLTTLTPLLLPTPASKQLAGEPKVFKTRRDSDGRPLIHGASFKGALRSAYETITASRYGVFFEHTEPLAYRVPANEALNLIPARVYRKPDGKDYFQLYRDVALVPAYSKDRLCQIGELSGKPLKELHGEKVFAWVVPQRSRRDSKAGGGKSQSWRVTHIAASREELDIRSHGTSSDRQKRVGEPEKLPHPKAKIVLGWLSITGHSIDTKQYERLFIDDPGERVSITPEHDRFWRSVLQAYDFAAKYNDPQATYQNAPRRSRVVERSLHVRKSDELRDLPDGTLVYVKFDAKRNEVTEVHPVMIGRLPFAAAPGELLHESLKPANEWDQLSPADRLFGWVPVDRSGDINDSDVSNGASNGAASGYRSRLRVRSITCTTHEWRPENFPKEGVTLAPLSAPKPTQFRFYASPDPNTGEPIGRRALKTEGYTSGGGLRGRKMYRWRREDPEYWQPAMAKKDDPIREYLALKGHAPSQLVCYRDWVKPGVTFQVELFLDGVPNAELAPLLWLLTQKDKAPLRLGGGKPYGFGVVSVGVDWRKTKIWDGAGVRDGWLQLERPQPASSDRLTQLASQFEESAYGNPVLREAVTSYLKAAAPVDHRIHYPRKTQARVPESYEWFVANERIKKGQSKGGQAQVVEGWALPHVRDDESRLPYLGTSNPEPTKGEASRTKSKLPRQRRSSKSARHDR